MLFDLIVLRSGLGYPVEELKQPRTQRFEPSAPALVLQSELRYTVSAVGVLRRLVVPVYSKSTVR